MNLKRELTSRIQQALIAAGAPDGTPALVGPARDAKFGDYQANGIMAAAKALKTNPRQLAEKVAAHLDLSDLAEKVEIAGPGFINITLKPEFLSTQLAAVSNDEKLGTPTPQTSQTVVVDYSSPNLAKEMHVGHLRSTIIGDALARVLEFCGHTVIRQNHVGDWGTQFGMLIEYVFKQTVRGAVKAQGGETRQEVTDTFRFTGDGRKSFDFEIEDLEAFYREARALYDSDPDFAAAARKRVVLLQSHDDMSLGVWEGFLKESLRHCHAVYSRLGACLVESDIRGESAYNDALGGVVETLWAKGMLTPSDGAQCVFLDEFKGKGTDDADVPVIVQKSDGGYLYATTDLAAIRYRVHDLHAGRVLYVTDSRQGQHFEMVFLTARKASFAGEASLEHVPFGMMLGNDKKPFKTRDGGTVKLMDLLDEAEKRTETFLRDRRQEMLDAGKEPPLPEDRIPEAARIVGIGAVKYADLAQNRASDYVFSWDKMLSLEGNTAPYMQYAYARVRSIFRRNESAIHNPQSAISVVEPAERALAVKLLQFPETIQAVADECLPNVLCAYLYELAGAFMSFYEACPVLQAADDATRTSRLALADLTARTIKTGLNLLGIETLEQM